MSIPDGKDPYRPHGPFLTHGYAEGEADFAVPEHEMHGLSRGAIIAIKMKEKLGLGGGKAAVRAKGANGKVSGRHSKPAVLSKREGNKAVTSHLKGVAAKDGQAKVAAAVKKGEKSSAAKSTGKAKAKSSPSKGKSGHSKGHTKSGHKSGGHSGGHDPIHAVEKLAKEKTAHFLELAKLAKEAVMASSGAGDVLKANKGH